LFNLINKIRILPEEVINRIAAGEVVERPASVLKELMENSLDEGSNKIVVQVRDGGRGGVMVSDDGFGMSEDDALLCFERHSTSKILGYSDLEQIKTLGFRGEALSSIAAVSMVEMKTGLKNNKEGSFVRVEGGIIKEVKKIAWEGGTTVNVRNIFYNTPGRRKFLKGKNTEFRHILKTFKQISLANCDKNFTIYSEDALVWQLEKSTLLKRMETFFGENIADMIMQMDEKQDEIELEGYIGKPQLVGSWYGEQYLFLNNRFIKNKGVSKAVFSGYGSSISAGDYPLFVIFLKLDPLRFDVNVHPAKLEVRFKDERGIYNFIYESVRKRLSDDESSPTTFFFDNRAKIFQKRKYSIPEPYEQNDVKVQFEMDYDREVMSEKSVEKKEKLEYFEREKIWQMHNKYVFSQIKSGIIIIDQHIAHERILFERILKRIKEKKCGGSQHLIFPVTINLSLEDRIIFDDIFPFLTMIGFQIKVFSENTIILEGVPNDLRKGGKEEIIKGIIDSYKKENREDFGVYEKIASSYACRAAIMAGDRLTVEEMINLIDELFATDFPYFCPHGRPTIINIPLSEIDKRFLR